MQVPYFAQWESRALVERFLKSPKEAEQDPLWERSGAKNPADYARWAGHLCGMACLKMILAYRDGRELPIVSLAKECVSFGGYKVGLTGEIKGLFYKPFTEYVRDKYDLRTEVIVDVTVDRILKELDEGRFFIPSVHPSIRHPENDPPSKGGHLVLAFGRSSDGAIQFHNPSGFTPQAQEDVRLMPDQFARFFAGRGVLVHVWPSRGAVATT